MSRTILLISGMRNNGCREILAAALERVEGVSEVQVNLYRAEAAVMHLLDVPASAMIKAVECAGFSATVAGRYAEETK